MVLSFTLPKHFASNSTSSHPGGMGKIDERVNNGNKKSRSHLPWLTTARDPKTGYGFIKTMLALAVLVVESDITSGKSAPASDHLPHAPDPAVR